MASRMSRAHMVRINEATRRAAMRDAHASPHAVIAQRVRASDEFKALMAAIEAEVTAFYASLPQDAAETVGILRLRGGRTAIRREIVQRLGATEVFQSELFGYAPLSSFVDMNDVQDFEIRAIRERARG